MGLPSDAMYSRGRSAFRAPRIRGQVAAIEIAVLASASLELERATQIKHGEERYAEEDQHHYQHHDRIDH